MKTSRNRQVCFENEGELIDDPLPTGTRVSNEQTRLGRVKDALSRVDELTNLERRRPHRALATRDSRVPVSVVEHLVRHERAAEAQQPQLDAANVQTPRRGLVENMQIFDVVLARAELLEHDHVLARAPDGVHGDL